MTNIVRFGDSIVLESCESSEHLFLGIIPRREGRRCPLLLSTEVAEAGKHPASDYQWRVLPVVGSKRKWGDPVSFADRIRLQMIDHRGNSRMLAVSHMDNRSIMAEKRPAAVESCIWWLSYTNELKVGRDGRVFPAGDLPPHLKYGDINYLTLVNGARYLATVDDPHGILRKRTALLNDLPTIGMAVWWHAYRSTSAVVPAAERESNPIAARAVQQRSFSMA